MIVYCWGLSKRLTLQYLFFHQTCFSFKCGLRFDIPGWFRHSFNWAISLQADRLTLNTSQTCFIIASHIPTTPAKISSLTQQGRIWTTLANFRHRFRPVKELLLCSVHVLKLVISSRVVVGLQILAREKALVKCFQCCNLLISVIVGLHLLQLIRARFFVETGSCLHVNSVLCSWQVIPGLISAQTASVFSGLLPCIGRFQAILQPLHLIPNVLDTLLEFCLAVLIHTLVLFELILHRF